MGEAKGRQLGGRQRVAGWVERERSLAGWKAKGHRKRRRLKDEASRTEHHRRVELHRRRFSLTITTLKRRCWASAHRWNLTVTLQCRDRWAESRVKLQLADEAQRRAERRDRRAERRHWASAVELQLANEAQRRVERRDQRAERHRWASARRWSSTATI